MSRAPSEHDGAQLYERRRCYGASGMVCGTFTAIQLVAPMGASDFVPSRAGRLQSPGMLRPLPLRLCRRMDWRKPRRKPRVAYRTRAGCADPTEALLAARSVLALASAGAGVHAAGDAAA